jgi:hypothetical protein
MTWRDRAARRRHWADRAWRRIERGDRWLAALIWLDRNGLLMPIKNQWITHDDGADDGRPGGAGGAHPGRMTVTL